MCQAQVWALLLLLIYPSHPTPIEPDQLSFFSIHCSNSIQLLLLSMFSHELETWVNFHHRGPSLVYQEVLAITEKVFFFSYTLDVKILHLILYVGDLWPKIVGNNYQLAT